ncbi:MAG: hypothetical protein Q4D95_07230 [Peptoniphilus sp.]|nr:hypothetical protein [Peptoniphilus sp.]
MDFILKDIYDIHGNLIVNRGTPINDDLLRKLNKHEITRLELGTIDVAKIADPVERIIKNSPVKSDMVEYLNSLEPTAYNYSLYTATLTNMIGEWVGLDEQQLKDATNYGMMMSSGLVTEGDTAGDDYKTLIEVAESYVKKVTRDGDNPFKALNRMWVEDLTKLDTGIVFLFIKRFCTMLLNSEVILNGEKYKLIYLSPTDLAHPILQKESGEVKIM